VATHSLPAPYRWSECSITVRRDDQWLNFDHPGKYPLLVDPVIQESQVKKVLVDGGSSINVTFPEHSEPWGSQLLTSLSWILRFSASCRLKERTR
jgi:hypothetical protein